MSLLRVTYRIVTPLFLSGAVQSEAELRGPSMKGALRYWYRAVDPRYNLSKNNDSTKKGESPTYEGDLFGGTGKGEGQARFLLRLHGADLQSEVWAGRRENPFYLRYLGFSLNNRRYFSPGQTFSVSFRLRPPISDQQKRKEDWQSLAASLWLLGHIGGLGSRSRRGFGTVALESWTVGEDPAAREVLEALPIAHSAKTVEEWMQRFQEGLDVIRSWFPTFTEFDHTVINSQTSFFLSASGFSDWRRALNKAAQSLKEFREKIDHQERVSLGLPLRVPHYRIQYHPVGGERTASPVWIRVVEIGNQYFPLFSFLTAPAPQVIEKRTHGEHSFAAPMEETLEHFRQRLREDGFSLEVSL